MVLRVTPTGVKQGQPPGLGDIDVEAQLNSAVNSALELTAEKSGKSLSEAAGLIGIPSPEHTNFRYFLSSSIAGILSTLFPMHNAWVYGIDPMDVSGSEDTAGSGSACDKATGSKLLLILEVDRRDELQGRFVKTVNDSLVRVLREKGGVNTEDEYLHADYITPEDIACRRGVAVRVTNYAHYPATPIWSAKKGSLI